MGPGPARLRSEPVPVVPIIGKAALSFQCKNFEFRSGVVWIWIWILHTFRRTILIDAPPYATEVVLH
jgi:hypothetical protein